MEDDDTIAASWKQEFEKYKVSKKYFSATQSVGIASSNPTIENARICYGRVIDFVSSLPLPTAKRSKASGERKKILNKLDDMSLVLYGNLKNENVQKLMRKHEIIVFPVRVGIKMVSVMQNIPNLIKELRSILIEAGEFATSAGLRITLPYKKEFGRNRLLKEEGFKDLKT